MLAIFFLLVYTSPVTEAAIVAHWRKGARDALRLAKHATMDTLYELALFHCHLTVEKALKAANMEKSGKPHPKVHALAQLAYLLRQHWSEENRELFDTLSDFAVAARYDDPAWAGRFATAQKARRWIGRSEAYLSTHAL